MSEQRYRMLDMGERLEPGDEVRFASFEWYPIPPHTIGREIKWTLGDAAFRRPIPPKAEEQTEVRGE